jgi:hypothetical protein
MEAPKPKIQEEILFTVQKELKSEQGNNFHLSIFYKHSNFYIQIEKKQKIFNDCFVKKLSFTEIQENEYFKLFSSPKEILEELKDNLIAHHDFFGKGRTDITYNEFVNFFQILSINYKTDEEFENFIKNSFNPN